MKLQNNREKIVRFMGKLFAKVKNKTQKSLKKPEKYNCLKCNYLSIFNAKKIDKKLH
jgi:transcription elongation factor Elf1